MSGKAHPVGTANEAVCSVFDLHDQQYPDVALSGANHQSFQKLG